MNNYVTVICRKTHKNYNADHVSNRYHIGLGIFLTLLKSDFHFLKENLVKQSCTTTHVEFFYKKYTGIFPENVGIL